jgi:hypothetical protein
MKSTNDYKGAIIVDPGLSMAAPSYAYDTGTRISMN